MNGDITVRWDSIPSGAFGTANSSTDVITLNSDYLDAGNCPVDLSVHSQTHHMLTSTIAHEVSHIVNGDTPSSSFDYFMAEYRAFYVGESVKHGRPPTNAEVQARVDLFLNSSSTGAYPTITEALNDPDEAAKIAEFVSQITGRPVTGDNVASEIASLDDPSATAPLPTEGNLDNS